MDPASRAGTMPLGPASLTDGLTPPENTVRAARSRQSGASDFGGRRGPSQVRFPGAALLVALVDVLAVAGANAAVVADVHGVVSGSAVDRRTALWQSSLPLGRDLARLTR